MKPPSRSWLWVVLAAAGATAVPGIRASAPAAVPPAQAHRQGAPKKPDSGTGAAVTRTSVANVKLHELLDGYLAFLGEDEDLGAAAQRYRRESRGDIFTLVATAPDPELTTFDSFFDQELDSIRAAARSLGFGPDRFYLPWASASEDTDLDIHMGAGSLAPGGPAAGAPPIRVRRHRDDTAERTPGILVFRRPSDPASPGPTSKASTASLSLLVVFVVGESLTTGIRRAAFSAALDLSDRLRSPHSPAHAVLAPFFSASMPSLRLALDGHRRGCQLLNVVVSGSANANGLRFDALGEWSSFHTTNRPVGELHDAILHVLDSARGGRATPLRVAELVEGTSWGQSVEREHPGLGPPGPKVTSFVFPLHVSELRAEHEKLKQGCAGDRSANLRTTLELHLDHGRESADDVPVRSALTPYNVELMLHEEMATIARDNFKYLGIVASDPADLIFLAGEARKYCPGVQLFALESNLLFAHPDVMAELNGMLIASTYPLSSDRAYSADGELDSLTFASQSAEGVFNASLALLREAKADRNGDANILLRDYRQPSGHFAPSVWITMVHNGSIWPLRVDERGPTACAPFGAPSPEPVIYSPGLPSCWDCMKWHPRAGKVVEGVYLLLLLAGGIWLANLLRLSRRARRPSSFDVALKVDRVRYLLGIWAPLGLACAYLTVVFGHLTVGRRLTDWSVTRWGLGLLVTAGTALVVVHLLGWQLPRQVLRLRRRWWDMRNSALPTVVAGLVVVALALLGWGYFHTIANASPHDPSLALAIDRTLQPLGGVSPGLPLLCLALGFFSWGYFGLRRVAEQERFPDSTPFPSSERLASAGLGTLAERIRASHTPGLFSIEHLFAFAVTAMLEVYFNRKLQRTLEDPTFDRLFRAAFLLLLALTTTNAGRLVAAWRDLRALLRRLAGHPMADAYDRLGPSAFSGSGLELGLHVPGLAELEAAVRSGMCLARAEPPFANRQQAEAYRYQIQIEAELAERIYTEELGPAPLDPRVGTRAALFRLARTVFSALERLWEGDSESAPPESLRHMLANVIPSEALADAPYRHVHTLALYNRLASPSAQIWQRLAEDFVACQVVALLRLALGRLRAMMTFGMVAALILVCVGASYPFQPSRFVTIFTWSMALAVMGAILTVIVEIERDQVLSRIAHTRPGHVELSGPFVARVAVYGALPMAALFATSFPTAGAVLLSWAEPLLRALH